MATKGRYDTLQALRAVAAIFVVMHHFILANKSYGNGGLAGLYNFSEIFACGVDLFFCISGFVMLKSILDAGEKFSSLNFCWNRFVRIVPIYWIASIAYIGIVTINSVLKTGISATLSGPMYEPLFLVTSFLLLPAHNPDSHSIQPFLAQGWTLTYEMYFYLMLLVSTLLCSHRKNLIPFVCIGLMVAAWALSSSIGGSSGIFLSNTIVIEFAFGMIVYGVFEKLIQWRLLMVIVAGLLFFWSAFSWIGIDRFVIWGIPAMLLLCGALGFESKKLTPKILIVIGDASYSLYLTHSIFSYVYGGLLKRGLFSSVLCQNSAIFVGTALSVIAALIFYKYIEKPVIGYMKSWISGRLVSC